MAKVGILGGTFNPIHNGHIALANCAYNQLNLDYVWFMPSKKPPHKDSNSIIAQEHRVSMIKYAIKDIPYFKFSGIELEREGTTYTSCTLEYLQNLRKEDIVYDNSYYFIVGADSIYNIESWNRPSVLFYLSDFVVACRDDVNRQQLEEKCLYLKNKYNARIHILDMGKVDISSSFIREYYNKYNKFAKPNDFLNIDVHNYILEHSLYV